MKTGGSLWLSGMLSESRGSSPEFKAEDEHRGSVPTLYTQNIKKLNKQP
jgi:hypothetical protein